MKSDAFTKQLYNAHEIFVNQLGPCDIETRELDEENDELVILSYTDVEEGLSFTWEFDRSCIDAATLDGDQIVITNKEGDEVGITLYALIKITPTA